MRFSIWPSTEASWDDLLQTVRHAEATGWDGVWIADHFMGAGAGADAPYLECWSVLAAIAAAVPRLRIGSLVSGNTYRTPALLLKAAVTADRVSGGRLVLGLGAGWQENEHVAYGIAFPSVKERMDRLEEACAVITSLRGNARSNFAGRYYHLVDAPAEPKPLGPLPLLVGGAGERRTLPIVARYADEWNTWGGPARLRAKGEVLDQHCAQVGRDPRSIRRSAQCLVYLSEDPTWVDEHRPLAQSRQPTIVGTPAEVVSVMNDYAAAGVDEFVLPDFNLGPGEAKMATMDLFIEQVATVVRRNGSPG